MFLAAQFIDLLWPTLLLLGIERVRIEPGVTEAVPLVFEYYPYSHSLLSVFGMAIGFALVYYTLRRYPRGAVVLGLALISHWCLDLVVHRPDLPLVPGIDIVAGLGLWSSVRGTLVVELSLFVLGVGFYLDATHSADSTGRWSLLALILFLFLIYLGNIFAKPPPSVVAIGVMGQAQWLLVAWGYWIDRHRIPG